MDPSREQERSRYRLCRLGLVFQSIGLCIAAVTSLIFLPAFFFRNRLLIWLLHTPVWKWSDAPVVWSCLVGWYLLWGRWREPGWMRRSGLLLAMGGVDVALWMMTHGAELGLRTGDVGHKWLRDNLGQALGWAEFALSASLACDVLTHLGVARAEETGRSTRSLASTGAAVWLLGFCFQTDWASGWPLTHRPVFTVETFLLELGSILIGTITLIQVAALSIAAAKRCSEVLDDMDKEDRDNDPFKPAFEKGYEAFSGADPPWGV